MRRGAVRFAAATLALTSIANADVAPKRALVRVDLSPTRYGSGVFVSEDPPVVATCFHVVANQPSIRVVPISFPDGSRGASVTEILAYPDRDIAFLKLDSTITRWSSHAGVPAASEPYPAELAVIGFGNYFADQVSERMNRMLRGEVNIWFMNGPLPILANRPVFNVIELGPNLLAGDSGAPVYLPNGTLVGLAAGRINRSDGERRYFAVSLAGLSAEPDASGWRRVPWNGSTPYSSSSITPLVWDIDRAQLPWTPSDFSAATADCRAPIEKVAVAYTYDRALMPVDLPVPASPACQKVYASTRTQLVVEDRAKRASSVYAQEAAIASAKATELQDSVQLVKRTAPTRKKAIDIAVSELEVNKRMRPSAFEIAAQEKVVVALKQADLFATKREVALERELKETEQDAKVAREKATLERAQAELAAAQARAAVARAQ